MSAFLQLCALLAVMPLVTAPAPTGQAAQSSSDPGKPLAQIDTTMPGVTARLESLRRLGGALVVRFDLHNGGSDHVSPDMTVAFERATIVDLKQNKKYQPMKVGGWVLAGPGTARAGTASAPGDVSSLTLTRGAVSRGLAPGESLRMWIIFPAPPAGAEDLTIDIPGLGAFAIIPVTAIAAIDKPQAPPVTQSVGTSGVSLTLSEAKRSGDRVTVQLLLKNEGKSARGSAFPRQGRFFVSYPPAVLLDLQNQKLYGPVKDPDGKPVARPINWEEQSQLAFGSMVGGSLGLNHFLNAAAQLPISMTFQAPPAAVDGVFIYIPDLPLFEHVGMAGKGVELTGGGQSITGTVKDLDGALKDLGAKVTDKEIQISLASDVLFDFDKADIRPDAAAALKNVGVIIAANPGGAVRIEGHTDSAGTDDYNLKLSERRAESVKAWLVGNEGIDRARLVTRGWGEAKPVAPNTTDEGRQKNRRVEIAVARTTKHSP